MFGIVRRKSNSQLVRQELGQGMEHFKQAATHAARGTGATVGPKFEAARDRVQPAAGRVKNVASTGWGSAVATLAPLAAAAGNGARKADKAGKNTRKDTRKAAQRNQKKLQKTTAKALGRQQNGPKKSKLTGLLIAGAAIGAVSAFVLRRRNSQQWDEYDPSRPTTSSDTSGTGATASDSTGFQSATPGGTAFTAPQTGSSAPYGGTTTPGAGSIPAAGEQVGDQTSSTLHSPTVARMAGGTNPS